MTAPSPPPSGPFTDDQVSWIDNHVRISRRRLVRRCVALIIAIAAVASFGLWRAESAVDRLRDESIDRQVAQCQSANEFRRLFRGYLATQGEGLDPETVTNLDGFDALPPATQDYVRRLAEAAATSAEAARQVRDEYVARFPLQNCDQLRATLEAGRAVSTTSTVPIVYANCDEVRTVGAAPLRRGEPGYSVALDGDGDGVACE